MPNLLLGNPLQSFNEGLQTGRSNRFSALAGQAVAAPVDQRADLIAQAAQADPLKAVALNGALNSQADGDEERRNKALVNMARFYVSAPDAAKPQVRAQLAPSLAKFGIDATNVSPEDFDKTAQAIVQAWTPVSAIPGGAREFQAKAAAAGLKPGTPEYERAAKVDLGLEARAVTGAVKTGMITGADGRERPYVFDPSSQSYKVFDGQTFRPLDQSEASQLGWSEQAPAAVAQPTPEQLMAQASAMANQGGPGANAAAAEAWLQQKLAGQGRLPTPVSGTGALGVGRAPEETAAATENAKQGVQLAYLPATERVKTDASVDEARRTAEAKAEVEAGAKQTADATQRKKDAQDTLRLLDAAEKILPNATGSAGGRLVDAAAASIGKSTTGAQATASLQTIAGQLTSKMPRMQGPQSDRDVELYKQMAGDLANPSLPVETRRAAAATIRELNQKYADGGAQAPTTSAPSPAGNFGHLWN